MPRTCAIAAALFLAFLAAGCGESKATLAHSCGATDRHFIQTATVNMTALTLWASGYQQGEIDADQVVSQAQDAAKRVDYAQPHDPSLRQAQTLLGAMFNEYAKAILAEEKGKQAGDKMYRAYGLANFARQVLVQAQPALKRRGCDVESLL
ncbi:MAG: hypothetical protein E6G67_03960 [Actinobacteria bacterium]|nr:MAG: hypothetical protein E6G67_03960 [Actinomycetota bacterium]